MRRCAMPEGSQTQFHVWFRGQHAIVRARDRMHAKIIAYAAIWPEAKWGEIHG